MAGYGDVSGKALNSAIDRRIQALGTPSVSNSNTDDSKVSTWSGSLGNKSVGKDLMKKMKGAPKGNGNFGPGNTFQRAAIERKLNKNTSTP